MPLLLEDFLIIAKYRKPPTAWTEDMIVSDVIERLMEGGVEVKLDAREDDSLVVRLNLKKGA